MEQFQIFIFFKSITSLVVDNTAYNPHFFGQRKETKKQ